MTNSKLDLVELDNTLITEHDSEYTVVIVGRDLSSYLIALILKQHGHRVAIVNRPRVLAMVDLAEFVSLKCLHEAAQRLNSIQYLSTKGLQIKYDDIESSFDWLKLTNECKQEILQTQHYFERELAEKDIPMYEGVIVLLEDYIVRIISEDQLTQLAVLHTKYVIMGSEICRCTINDYSNKSRQSNTLKTLSDLIHLEQIPETLTVIGGGSLGLSVASCMKQLGCERVMVIEQQPHCLTNTNDIDREIAMYIESTLVKQEIDIITKTTIHSLSDPIKTNYRFIAVGAGRKFHSVNAHPTTSIIQLIERVSFGRKIQLGTMVDDGTGETVVSTVTPIIPIDYQRVKSECSIEQGVTIAYRTICKCFNHLKPNFLMPSFIHTIPPLLLIGRTRTPADDMFTCRIAVPLTMKYATDSPPTGFGKLWISRTRKILCGVQLVSEHALMFGKVFGILIRNETLLNDICKRIELPGSVGEAAQLMIKQAMYDINKRNRTS